MKLLGILLLAFASQAHGQSRLFMSRLEAALPARDTVAALEKMKASKEEYDFLASGMTDLESLFLGHMYATSRNRPDDLSRSEVLTTMAEVTTAVWKGSQYNKGKSWASVHKYLRRASYRSTCKFNILRCAVFRIALVDNEGKRFYYNRMGSPGALNLFKGTYPTFKERLDEDAPEPEALHFFSEEVLVAQFERQLQKQAQYADLRKGNFCCVGISVEIDEKTLNRKKIPTARVVVLFGARRLKHLKSELPKPQGLAEVKTND